MGTGHGILMTIVYLSLSSAAPLEELSSVRPLASVFHPALIASMIGQFVIHLGLMVYASRLAQGHPSYVKPEPGESFKPNLFNSVIFLVSTIQQVVDAACPIPNRWISANYLVYPHSRQLWCFGMGSVDAFYLCEESLLR